MMSVRNKLPAHLTSFLEGQLNRLAQNKKRMDLLGTALREVKKEMGYLRRTETTSGIITHNPSKVQPLIPPISSKDRMIEAIQSNRTLLKIWGGYCKTNNWDSWSEAESFWEVDFPRVLSQLQPALKMREGTVMESLTGGFENFLRSVYPQNVASNTQYFLPPQRISRG
jgi:hypothetical protein